MANDRLSFTLDIDSLESPDIQRFELEEAISEPFDLRVEVRGSADLDPSTLLGQDAVFTVARGEVSERTVGVVTAVTALPRADERILSIRVQPALALLALRRNSKIFQDQTVEEIVQSVLDEALGPYSREAELSLNGSYEAREYCVQYEESDLAFVHRLLEDEGIHYVFDHEGDQERILLGDDNGAFDELGAIPFQPDDYAIDDGEVIRQFLPARRVSITHVHRRDWNFKSASAPVDDEDGADDEDFPGERRHYDQAVGRQMTGPLLKTRAQRRAEAFVVEGMRRRGVSHALAVRPGRTFEMNDSPIVDANGTFLVTRAHHDSHRARRGQQAFGRDEETAIAYESRFEAVESEHAFRPERRTARPFIEGVETAKVVGPAGEEIHPDEHGRVKVLFPWDRDGAGDETSSCWIRVEQPWAGDGWGWMFIPRMGMEVVVQFVDGDPDRPLITGCVYNGENLPPYELDGEKTKSTFKTNSSIGGGGYNEFRFEDAKGDEQVFTHAQKDFDEEVLNNHTTDVGHDQTNTVDGNQVQDVGNNQTETVGKDQTMTVLGHRDVHVKTDFMETISGGELKVVLGGSKEIYKSKETRIVTGGITEAIIGGENHKVDGNKTEAIIGAHSQVVVGDASESVTGASTNIVGGGVTVVTPANLAWRASSGMTVLSGAATNFIAPPTLNIMGSSLVDVAGTFTKMGATSLNIHLVKASATGTTTALTGISLSFLGVSASATGASASVSGLSVDLGEPYARSLVGIFITFGAFKFHREGFHLTM